MSLTKRAGAEMLGTFWLVLEGAAAQCSPQHSPTWALVYLASPAPSEARAFPHGSPSGLPPTAIHTGRGFWSGRGYTGRSLIGGRDFPTR